MEETHLLSLKITIIINYLHSKHRKLSKNHSKQEELLLTRQPSSLILLLVEAMTSISADQDFQVLHATHQLELAQGSSAMSPVMKALVLEYSSTISFYHILQVWDHLFILFIDNNLKTFVYLNTKRPRLCLGLKSTNLLIDYFILLLCGGLLLILIQQELIELLLRR